MLDSIFKNRTMVIHAKETPREAEKAKTETESRKPQRRNFMLPRLICEAFLSTDLKDLLATHSSFHTSSRAFLTSKPQQSSLNSENRSRIKPSPSHNKPS